MSGIDRSTESALPSTHRDENLSLFLRQQSQQQRPNVLPEEIRIEIHSTPVPEVQLPTNFPTMPHNFSSLLNQARTQIGRQGDSRRWEANIRNVFQGVRPLVRRAQSMNTFRTLMPVNNFPYMPLRVENERSELDGEPANLDANVNTLNASNLSTETSPGDSSQATRPNILEEPASPARPILDRVAALTRDDPPDLIEGASMGRSNRRPSDNPDEDAVAEVFAQVPEARQAFNVLARYIPFLCILLAKSAYDHLNGIIDLTALIAIFMHANNIVRNQALKQTQRQLLMLARELLYIAVIVFLRFYYTEDDIFLGLLLFGNIPNTITLGQLLFSVAVTDLLLKLITIAVKIHVIMIPPTLIRYKGRGRLFVLIESISQLYRALAPIKVWLVFLLDSYSGIEKILGVLFAAAYMVSKGFDLVERFKLCRKAFLGFLKQVNYGSVPTKEDLQVAGGLCPICHDGFDTPVMLECKHIFCELCVSTWFCKQQTCPLCRSTVAEDPAWQDGATTFFLQLY